MNRYKNPFNPSKINGIIPDALEREDASANALLMTVVRAGEVRMFYCIADNIILILPDRSFIEIPNIMRTISSECLSFAPLALLGISQNTYFQGEHATETIHGISY
jgi:antirestriction protein ArdC